MPRTKEANKQIKDERKSNILLAAAPLFALYNDKVSVDMICEKANCSHGLLYHYFRDANNVLFNIRKTERYVSLQNQLLDIQDNGSPIDAIYQIVNNVNNVLVNAKNDDISLLILILQDNEKNCFKASLISQIKNGQKEGQVTAGNPEKIAEIFINQNIGVLYRKLLQKSYKSEIIPVDNLIQIFNKKRF